MIRSISLALLLLSSKVFAGYGIVTTLEAPIVRDISIDAPVVMTARKGDKIYIHEKYFINGPLDVVYQADDKQTAADLAVENEQGYEKFYETIDKNGNTAYISRYYVKLITQDIREFSQAVTPFDPDPNDYRIAEPLPDNYPFGELKTSRATLSFQVGPDLKSNYNYNRVVTEESYTNRYGVQVAYGRKANWDEENRFYFGGLFHAWTSGASFTLFDDRKTTESRSQLALGPYISYDSWRSQGKRLTLQGSLLVNYTRNIVKQEDISAFQEERIFKGFSMSPKISSFFQMETNTPDVEFIAGMDVQFYMPQNLKSSKEPETDFWNDFNSGTDSIYIPFSAHWSVFVGIQTSY